MSAIKFWEKKKEKKKNNKKTKKKKTKKKKKKLYGVYATDSFVSSKQSKTLFRLLN